MDVKITISFSKPFSLEKNPLFCSRRGSFKMEFCWILCSKGSFLNWFILFCFVFQQKIKNCSFVGLSFSFMLLMRHSRLARLLTPWTGLNISSLCMVPLKPHYTHEQPANKTRNSTKINHQTSFLQHIVYNYHKYLECEIVE